MLSVRPAPVGQILADPQHAAILIPAFSRFPEVAAACNGKFINYAKISNDAQVARVLQNRRAIDPGSPEFGGAFEHWVFHELRCYADYMGKGAGLAFWRSLGGYEVDFILNDEIAIEVKASENIDARDMKGLRALMEERLLKNVIVVSREKMIRKVGGITILPWSHFMTALWQNGLQEV